MSNKEGKEENKSTEQSSPGQRIKTRGTKKSGKILSRDPMKKNKTTTTTNRPDFQLSTQAQLMLWDLQGWVMERCNSGSQYCTESQNSYGKVSNALTKKE